MLIIIILKSHEVANAIDEAAVISLVLTRLGAGAGEGLAVWAD